MPDGKGEVLDDSVSVSVEKPPTCRCILKEKKKELFITIRSCVKELV